MLSKNPSLISAKLAKILNVQIRTVERNIQKLKKEGILDRSGANKDGVWVVKIQFLHCQKLYATDDKTWFYKDGKSG